MDVKRSTRTDTAPQPTDLRTIYSSTLPDVFGYLLMHTAGDRALAEDIAADTYVDAARHMATDGRRDEVTIPWLKTVARRRLIDHWRREASQQRRARDLAIHLAAVRPTDVETSSIEREQVHAALAELHPDHRIVLLLRHLDGIPVPEIARHIDRTIEGTGSLLSRARRAFRDAYGGELDD